MIHGMLSLGREWAERLMTDSVVGTFGSSEEWDEERLEYVVTPAVVYSGKARLKFGSVEQLTESAGAYVGVQPATMFVPVEGTGTLPIGTVFEITASETDPSNVGRRFRVTGIHAQTQATARRFPVEHYE